jgi:gamma-glutamyltranspeptidase/glutathione hydrolase/leukotriene-C4 hydrolase
LYIIGSRKRPLSSATPTIIEKDSEFEIVIGGSGGSLIPTATLYVRKFFINIVLECV